MDEIQDVIPLLYMNGLSSRKVKKSVAKLLGKKGLSRPNVISITEKIVEEFNKWRRRDLSDLKGVYLILDGVRLGVKAGTREKEAVLVAGAFLEDMVKRGLNEPLLAVIDGCPELGKAVKELFRDSDIQRCTKHKTENVLNKVLKGDRGKVKDSIREDILCLNI